MIIAILRKNVNSADSALYLSDWVERKAQLFSHIEKHA
jgi:hypothetical protein